MKLKKRFWEIDFLRGVAIVMMVIFHLVFNLNYFWQQNFNLNSGFWFYFARFVAIIFILLVGVSLYLSINKDFFSYFKRGLFVFSLGLLITLVTRFFLRENFIFFGVLHFIGLSIILAYPFLKLKWENLFLGILFIIFAYYIKNLFFNFSGFAWLGFRSGDFSTIDYFPVFPWFGFVLVGLFFGNVLYFNNIRQFKLTEQGENKIFQPFCFLGQNSLLIYLVHQPILMLVLYIFNKIDFMLF